MRRRDAGGDGAAQALAFPADRCESPFAGGALGRPESFLTAPRQCNKPARYMLRVKMTRELREGEYDEAACCLSHRRGIESGGSSRPTRAVLAALAAVVSWEDFG